MAKLIKEGQQGVQLSKIIHLKKEGNEPDFPNSELQSWLPDIRPEERMDLTTLQLNERLSTYRPTKELLINSEGIAHPFNWGEATTTLPILLAGAPFVLEGLKAAGATVLTNPIGVAAELGKDMLTYTAADVVSQGITGLGVADNFNDILNLPKGHPLGELGGFTTTSLLRRPLEKAGVTTYKAIRGTLLPEYALSKAMNLALLKPYVSRVVGENGKIRLRLPGHTNEAPSELVVVPRGNNQFEVHIRTLEGSLSLWLIGNLYEALYNELPEGAEILFPESGPGYYAKRGTVAALQRLGRDPRFSKGSPGTLLYTDKDGSIKEFTGTSFIKTPTTPSRVITYKEPTYPLYYKNTFNFPGLEQYNYGVLPVRDTAIRSLQHLLDKQALLMFKEYGGIKIPNELPIKNELLLYAKEARVRYGLEGNTEITDLEIAEALYKHLVENDVVTYPGWGPLVGFRGTTSRANYLRSTVGPTEYATRATSGSMDNSLGKLFLGRLPFSNPVRGSLWNKGVDRYLYVARPISSDNPNFFDLRLEGAGKIDITPQFFVNIPERVPIELVNKDLFNKYFLYSLGNFRDASGAYKVRPEYTEKGINDLNAYMFRTPAYRDITNEMSVANWNSTTYPENNFLWLTKEKPIINPDGISGTYKGQEVIFMDSGLESDPGLRRLVGDLYLAIHENAIKNNLGLYISRPSVFRQEHRYYPYIALPQWNLINAKHILPYDLRLPRLWGDPNVYLKAGGKLVKRINS